MQMFLQKAYGKTTVTAIVLDVVVLVALLAVKAQTDQMVIYAALVGIAIVFGRREAFYTILSATRSIVKPSQRRGPFKRWPTWWPRSLINRKTGKKAA